MSRAAPLFESVVVGVAQSPSKGPSLPLQQRVTLAREALCQHENVQVIGFDTLLAHFVRHVGAVCCCVACVRFRISSMSSRWRVMNRHLIPEVETLFLTSGGAA